MVAQTMEAPKGEKGIRAAALRYVSRQVDEETSLTDNGGTDSTNVSGEEEAAANERKRSRRLQHRREDRAMRRLDD